MVVVLVDEDHVDVALLQLLRGVDPREAAAGDHDAGTPAAVEVAGGVIAFCQVGYGIAAFGIGPLLANACRRSSIPGRPVALVSAQWST